MRWAALAPLALVALSLAAARADGPAPPGLPPSAVSVEVVPAFSTASSAGQVVPSGWNDVLVRVRNGGAEPVRGEIHVVDRSFTSHEGDESTTVAPFAAGPGATVFVRVPVAVAPYASLQADVVDAAGAVLSTSHFNTF
ncbi:MAG TPA: hypothetical protein VHB21_04000, partial [Minicystis sp.]|nr:hypothetical protein [Minicystis sp.]